MLCYFIHIQCVFCPAWPLPGICFLFSILFWSRLQWLPCVILLVVSQPSPWIHRLVRTTAASLPVCVFVCYTYAEECTHWPPFSHLSFLMCSPYVIVAHLTFWWIKKSYSSSNVTSSSRYVVSLLQLWCVILDPLTQQVLSPDIINISHWPGFKLQSIKPVRLSPGSWR